jgi:hypothetical protein
VKWTLLSFGNGFNAFGQRDERVVRTPRYKTTASDTCAIGKKIGFNSNSVIDPNIGVIPYFPAQQRTEINLLVGKFFCRIVREGVMFR